MSISDDDLREETVTLTRQECTIIKKELLLELAKEIGNRFYHSHDITGKGGNVFPCERFCSHCDTTKSIVNYITKKANEM